MKTETCLPTVNSEISSFGDKLSSNLDGKNTNHLTLLNCESNVWGVLKGLDIKEVVDGYGIIS